MKIDITLIPPEGLEVSGREDPALLELNTDDIDFVSPLAIKCRAVGTADGINISGLFEAEARFRCSRCAEKFFSNIKGSFSFDRSIEEKTILDITDSIREEVILSYPSVLLCKKDCRGLCLHCGQNLNRKKCKCKTTAVDGRLSKLKEWKG
ncbi:MAG: DUF177 domain-containing protein [Candidatus Omnitrophota bacterium]|nr:DUF177 domain-containing protein [Candidatus Omnitrophota bacterium]